MTTTFRKRPIRAAFYDGKIIGERLPDGTVKTESCPDWFPAVVPITHPENTWAAAGEVFIAGDVLIVGARNGSQPVHPGSWIIKHPDQIAFDVLSNDLFELAYEPT